MSQVKNQKKKNLKLRVEISAVNSELQTLKSIIEQQRLQADTSQVGDAATRYGYGPLVWGPPYNEKHSGRENISKELELTI